MRSRNAISTPITDCRAAGPLFQPPLDAAAPAEILRHFRQCPGGKYFPILGEKPVPPGQIDGILADRFSFAGQTYELPAPMDWLRNPSPDKQWHVTLHKFYYGVELGRRYRRDQDDRLLRKWIELVQSWIEQVPPGFLSCQVTGRRIQNWISAHYYFVTESPAAAIDPVFYQRFLVSLHEQVEHLVANLSPARNHRTLELFAIFFAAMAFPEFKRSRAWREFSLAELYANICQDLLPDGVQCEQSIDYHHLVLKNYLGVRQLARVNDLTVPAGMDDRIQRALEFALHAHRPDGFIPAVSDGDSRNFLGLLELGYQLYGREDLLYVARQGAAGRPPAVRSRGFPQGGYWFLRSGWGESEPFADERYLLLDCGPLGVGNHGHFDLLSVELAAYGRPLVIDPGRYTYHQDSEVNWRARFRSTAAHNTVVVDGKNQTRYEPRKGWCRITGPAPDYELRSFATAADCDYLHGICRSQEYEAVHERKILFVVPDYWVIVDVLRGSDDHQYELAYQLDAPAQGRVTLTTDGETQRVVSPQLVLAQPLDESVQTSIEDSWVSRSYGSKEPAPVVRYRCQARDAVFVTVLYPFRTRTPRLAVSRLPVSTSAGEPAALAAQALRITVDTGEDHWVDECLLADSAAGSGWRFGESISARDHQLVRRRGPACGEA